MAQGARELKELALPNAMLLIADLDYASDYFAANEVSSISINFCNPWPKRRHQKRRLTHPRKLKQYRTFLKDGGLLHFKTDDADLYQASLDYFPSCGFDIVRKTSDLKPEEDPSGIITEYEERWRKEGIKIKAIEVVKRAD